MHEVPHPNRFFCCLLPLISDSQFLLQVGEGGRTLRGRGGEEGYEEYASMSNLLRVEAQEVDSAPHQIGSLYEEGEMSHLSTLGQHY